MSGPESKPEGETAKIAVLGFPIVRLTTVRTSAKQNGGEGRFHDLMPNSAIIRSRHVVGS